ncbi:MAG: hypothetical protein ACUVRU_12995 [Anaerolineae bacterium]
MQAIRSRLASSRLVARLLATLLFGAFIYLGANGISDAAAIFINPSASTVLLPISAESARVRAIVLMAINLVIALGGAAAILGVWQRTRLLYGWVVVALMYAVLGGYQIAGALVEFHRPEFAVAGLAYLLLAAAAWSFGRRFMRSAAGHSSSMSSRGH